VLLIKLLDIVELDISHYEQIIGLWKDCQLPFKENGRDSYSNMMYRLSHTDTKIFGIWENKDLITSVVLSSDGQRGWINRIAIHPNHRRKGLARTIIDFSEEYFTTKKILLFCALIEKDNISSLNLFESQNYVLHDEILYVSKRLRIDY
jgi:N-acetylglutamate synthase